MYTIGSLGSRNYRQLHVTLSGAELWIDRMPFSWEKTTNPLIPVGENTFDANFGRRLRFIMENRAVNIFSGLNVPHRARRTVHWHERNGLKAVATGEFGTDLASVLDR